METFFQTHAYLIERTNLPVRRALMDSIDWTYRLIGIRGPRGVGRTSFLLQYAKEHYDVRMRNCLYINCNSFYFQGCGIVDFAGKFVMQGGMVLLLDQAFKLTDWRKQVLECYHKYPRLRIVYTTTSVPDNDCDDELASIARTYVLHGFSFREYINLQTGNDFRPYSIDELLTNHEQILKTILPKVRPWQYFQEYLHHGYFPFFLENRNFTEALLKAMNNMIEVDVLFNKQIELKYLSKIKKLLYHLAVVGPVAPNISQLATSIQTSRATVMNYIKYLADARLINLIYPKGEEFPKKPSKLMMHNSNLMYAIYPIKVEEQNMLETFFLNSLYKDHKLYKGDKGTSFLVDDDLHFRICNEHSKFKNSPKVYYALHNLRSGHENLLPLWLFGFLY